jgi:hypothetical protein
MNKTAEKGASECRTRVEHNNELPGHLSLYQLTPELLSTQSIDGPAPPQVFGKALAIHPSLFVWLVADGWC